MGGKWSPDGVAAGRKSRILRKSRSDFLTGVVAAEGWSSEYRPSRRPGVEKPRVSGLGEFGFRWAQFGVKGCVGCSKLAFAQQAEFRVQVHSSGGFQG